MTLDFKVLYVFVAMEIGSRRILHTAVTSHPTAEWTIQQFRETPPFDDPYKFVLHDHAIFSAQVDTGEHPGIPEPPLNTVPPGPNRHKLPDGYRVTAKPVLGGLHHEYGLKRRLRDAD